MRFMVTVPASKESEAGVIPDAKLMAEMGKFNQEMNQAGVVLAAEGLHPTSKGARLKFTGGASQVIDGPFTESKELIAGFWIIQVKSKEEAIEWMRRAPFGEGVVLEIRQIMGMEDFPDTMTPEHRERAKRFREEQSVLREQPGKNEGR
jgi:hypothetical protein